MKLGVKPSVKVGAKLNAKDGAKLQTSGLSLALDLS